MQGAPAGPPRAGAIWLVCGLSYAAAVFHRSSLGVASLDAQERFGVGAIGISLISVVQVAVYAGLQVPSGALLDRFGPRRLLVWAACVLAAGQTVLALADTLPLALLARVLVGAGDALTFISVLTLITGWFPPHRVPLATQLTGVVGMVGQVASVYPLVTLLGSAGWRAAFLSVAAISLGIGAVSFRVVRDPVPRDHMGAAVARARTTLAAAWREPGTRLGLWAHFTTLFPGMVFGLLWGYPFLVAGQQRSSSEAALLLSLMVIGSMVAGPLLGGAVGRRPSARGVLVVGIVAASAGAWTLVLAWPGPAPFAVLVLLVLALSTNGPGSVIGFDYARTSNPPERIGSASAIVNTGGFLAALFTVLAIGLVLQATSSAGVATPSSYRWAFAVQYLVWGVGLGCFLRQRRMTDEAVDAQRTTPPPSATRPASRADRRPNA